MDKEFMDNCTRAGTCSNVSHPTSLQSNNAEDLWEENNHFARTVAPAMAFVALLMLLGCVGNSLVVLVYGFRFKSATQNSLIVSLACFDLLMSTLAMPSEILDMRLHHNFSSASACKMLRFITMFSSISSSFVLVVIAADRHLRITSPLSRQMSVRTARILEAVIVVGSLAFSWPSLVITGLRSSETRVPGLTGSDCSFSDRFSETMFPLAHNAVLGAGFMVVFSVLAVLYFRIWKQAKRGAAKINRPQGFILDEPVFVTPLSARSVSARSVSARSVSPAPVSGTSVSGILAAEDSGSAVLGSATSGSQSSVVDVSLSQFSISDASLSTLLDSKASFLEMPVSGMSVSTECVSGMVVSDDSVTVVNASEDSVTIVAVLEDSVMVVPVLEDSVTVVSASEDSVMGGPALEDSVTVVSASEDSVMGGPALEDSITVEPTSEDYVTIVPPLEDSITVVHAPIPSTASMFSQEPVPTGSNIAYRVPMSISSPERYLLSQSKWRLWNDSSDNPSIDTLREKQVSRRCLSTSDSELAFTDLRPQNRAHIRVISISKEDMAPADLDRPHSALRHSTFRHKTRLCDRLATATLRGHPYKGRDFENNHRRNCRKSYLISPCDINENGRKMAPFLRASSLNSGNCYCVHMPFLEMLSSSKFGDSTGTREKVMTRGRDTVWDNYFDGTPNTATPVESKYSCCWNQVKLTVDSERKNYHDQMKNVTLHCDTRNIFECDKTFINYSKPKKVTKNIESDRNRACDKVNTVGDTFECEKFPCESPLTNIETPGYSYWWTAIALPLNISFANNLLHAPSDTRRCCEDRNSKRLVNQSVDDHIPVLENKDLVSNVKPYRITSSRETTRTPAPIVHRKVFPSVDKTTIVAFAVSSVFILSFLPYLVLMFVRAFISNFDYGLEGVPLCVYNIMLRFYLLNSALNPVIYGLLSRRFRRECQRLLCLNYSGNKAGSEVR